MNGSWRALFVGAAVVATAWCLCQTSQAAAGEKLQVQTAVYTQVGTTPVQMVHWRYRPYASYYAYRPYYQPYYSAYRPYYSSYYAPYGYSYSSYYAPYNYGLYARPYISFYGGFYNGPYGYYRPYWGYNPFYGGYYW